MVAKTKEPALEKTEQIQHALTQDDCFGYYAHAKGKTVGFALVRNFEEDGYFIWKTYIGEPYQGQGFGKRLVEELIDELKKVKKAKVITTSYTYGDTASKVLYEHLGFEQMDTVQDGDVQMVNMRLLLKG